jgi:hypothetical protein
MDDLLIILNQLFYSIITYQLLLTFHFLHMNVKSPYFLIIIHQHCILVCII